MLKKFTPYFLLLIIIGFSSCAKMGYIGQSYTATQKIDVYITEQSISKPFKYIGKGYLANRTGLISHDKIQQMAEDLGRKKGADAVLIMDYLAATTQGTTISTVSKTDSSFAGVTQTGSTVISPSMERSFNILFIKYDQ